MLHRVELCLCGIYVRSSHFLLNAIKNSTIFRNIFEWILFHLNEHRDWSLDISFDQIYFRALFRVQRDLTQQ